MRPNILFSSLCLCLFLLPKAFAQQLDSLQLSLKTDEELLSLWENLYPDSLQQEQVIRYYIDRARTQNDTIKIARGYDRLSLTFGFARGMAYADTLLAITHNWDHITYPGSVYLTKYWHYAVSDSLKPMYQNLLLADSISRQRKNITQQMYVANRIVVLQLQWGDRQKALDRQKRNHEWFSHPDFYQLQKAATRKDMLPHLDDIILDELTDSYRLFVYCYYNLDQFELANTYLDSMAITMAKKVVNGNYGNDKDYYENTRAELLYWSGDYRKAVLALKPLIEKRMLEESPYSLEDLFFAYGMARINLGEHEEGLLWLQKADSIVSQPGTEVDYRADKILYTTLFEEYNRLGRYQDAIESLDRLIELERLNSLNYGFLEPNLKDDFETPKLLEEKEHLIRQLNSRNQKLTYWQVTLLVLLLVSLGWGLNYYRKQRLYRKRFEQLMQTPPIEIPKARRAISSQQEREIIQNLELFVESQGYLDNQLNLQKLAKQLETNANYLSKVINAQFGKNLSQFLHDLRVEYAKNRLLDDPKFRLFTVKAIAEESGYRNAESFSSAFHKRHGIYPSYYIRQLSKTD